MNARYFHNFTKAECRDGKPSFKETLLVVSKGGATETWLFNYISFAPSLVVRRVRETYESFPAALCIFSRRRESIAYGVNAQQSSPGCTVFLHSTQCTIMVSPMATIAYWDGKPVPYEGFLRADVGIRPYKWGADCRASLPTGSQ